MRPIVPPASFYRTHRLELLRRLSDGWIFVRGGQEIVRNHDVHYTFRQHSHFLYLTGIEDPGYALFLNPETGEERLFIPRIDQKHRVWSGNVPGVTESKALYGVRRVAYLDEIGRWIRPRKRQPIYGDKASLAFLATHIGPFQKDSREFEEALSELRIVKSEAELELIAYANRASAAGHIAAMAASRPGMAEYQLQAVLEARFRDAGLRHNAYDSIVAAGPNSAVLHYHANQSRLKKGDWVLIDAGAECKGYAADITRTFPINGKFTTRQKDVYNIVLAVQKMGISLLGPGVSMLDLHLESVKMILEGLKSLKIVSGSVDTLLETGVHRVFYPHGLSHTLGLDVHDVTGGKKCQGKKRKLPGDMALRFDRILERGFVVTMEPGLYFIPTLLHDPKIRKKYRSQINFERAERFIPLGGARIEDDIAITDYGHRNLTTVPKEIADIEAICSK